MKNIGRVMSMILIASMSFLLLCFGVKSVTSSALAYVNGGGIYVNGKNLDLNGGSISGKLAEAGGGVYVNSGEVNINCNIENNKSNTDGGGIYVAGGTVNIGSLWDYESPKISGNTNGVGEVGGGGICVNSGTVMFNRGEISGNAASRYGGGVYVKNGTFTMNGGKITNNKTEFVSPGIGSAVAVLGGTFNMKGGVIEGNAEAILGGVYIGSKGTFNYYGGKIVDEIYLDDSYITLHGEPSYPLTISLGGEDPEAIGRVVAVLDGIETVDLSLFNVNFDTERRTLGLREVEPDKWVVEVVERDYYLFTLRVNDPSIAHFELSDTNNTEDYQNFYMTEYFQERTFKVPFENDLTFICNWAYDDNNSDYRAFMEIPFFWARDSWAMVDLLLKFNEYDDDYLINRLDSVVVNGITYTDTQSSIGSDNIDGDITITFNVSRLYRKQLPLYFGYGSMNGYFDQLINLLDYRGEDIFQYSYEETRFSVRNEEYDFIGGISYDEYYVYTFDSEYLTFDEEVVDNHYGYLITYPGISYSIDDNKFTIRAGGEYDDVDSLLTNQLSFSVSLNLQEIENMFGDAEYARPEKWTIWGVYSENFQNPVVLDEIRFDYDIRSDENYNEVWTLKPLHHKGSITTSPDDLSTLSGIYVTITYGDESWMTNKYYYLRDAVMSGAPFDQPIRIAKPSYYRPLRAELVFACAMSLARNFDYDYDRERILEAYNTFKDMSYEQLASYEGVIYEFVPYDDPIINQNGEIDNNTGWPLDMLLDLSLCDMYIGDWCYHVPNDDSSYYSYEFNEFISNRAGFDVYSNNINDILKQLYAEDGYYLNIGQTNDILALSPNDFDVGSSNLQKLGFVGPLRYWDSVDSYNFPWGPSEVWDQFTSNVMQYSYDFYRYPSDLIGTRNNNEIFNLMYYYFTYMNEGAEGFVVDARELAEISRKFGEMGITDIFSDWTVKSFSKALEPNGYENDYYGYFDWLEVGGFIDKIIIIDPDYFYYGSGPEVMLELARLIRDDHLSNDGINEILKYNPHMTIDNLGIGDDYVGDAVGDGRRAFVANDIQFIDTKRFFVEPVLNKRGED